MVKVHCRVCGLYLGSTKEEDFPIQITCPVCEQVRDETRHALGQPQAEQKGQSWLSQIMERQVENHNAANLVRHIVVGMEAVYYDFPPLPRMNGVGR